jgi:hypothetical protein
MDDMAVRTSWWDDFPWLDAELLLRLHPYRPKQTQLNLPRRGGPYCRNKHSGDGLVSFLGEERPNISEISCLGK